MNIVKKLILSEKGFYHIILFLIFVHFIFRGLLYSGAPTDDAEQMLFSQKLRWGYDIYNPPLYTWLVILVQKVIGINLSSVAIVKFFAYGLIFVFSYKTALKILNDKALAFVAALSPLWFYYVGWDAALSYSHTILAASLIVINLYVLLCLKDNDSVFLYLLFGIIIGLGILSKYTFVFFILSALTASICSPLMRGHLNLSLLIMSVFVASVIVLPHGIWLMQNIETVGPAISQKFNISGASSFFAARLTGFKSITISFIGFLSPLWIILCIFFWRQIQEEIKRSGGKGVYVEFFKVYFLVLGVLILSLLVAFGFSKFRAHYFFVLIPAPIAFFAWLKPRLNLPEDVSYYGYSLVFAVFLCGGGMVVKYYTEPLRCSLCQLLVPYPTLGVFFKNIGFKDGTVFAHYHPHDLAGNFRSLFPKAQIVSTKFPNLVDRNKKTGGQCLIVWTPKPQGFMNGLGMAHLLNKKLGGNLPIREWSRNQNKVPEVSQDYIFDRSKNKLGKISYIFLKEGSGYCK